MIPIWRCVSPLGGYGLDDRVDASAADDDVARGEVFVHIADEAADLDLRRRAVLAAYDVLYV